MTDTKLDEAVKALDKIECTGFVALTLTRIIRAALKEAAQERQQLREPKKICTVPGCAGCFTMTGGVIVEEGE